MTLLQNILNEVKNFLTKVEHKLPTILTDGATFGISFIDKAEAILNGTAANTIASIVPDAEPLKGEILAILNELETAFKAVQGLYQKTALLTAAAQIAQLKTGTDIPIGTIILAVQAQRESVK